MLPSSLVPAVRAFALLVPILAMALAACAAPAPPNDSPFYLAPPVSGHASAAPGLEIGTHRNRGQPDDGSPPGVPGASYSSPADRPAGGIAPGNGSMSFGAGGGG